MFVSRPNVSEYSELIDRMADVKYALSMAEWNLDRTVANNMRTSIKSGGKTKEIEVAKVIGNTPEDERFINDSKQGIFDLKRKVASLQGLVNTWLAKKDLYVTDSYHMVRGSVKHTEGDSED